MYVFGLPMAENTEDIQKLINVLDIWCNNNCLKVNLSKSNVMHFRNPSVDRSNYQFIRVITKLPNSEQSYKGKVKTTKVSNNLVKILCWKPPCVLDFTISRPNARLADLAIAFAIN
jgi:hypothetical protein